MNGFWDLVRMDERTDGRMDERTDGTKFIGPISASRGTKYKTGIFAKIF